MFFLLFMTFLLRYLIFRKQPPYLLSCCLICCESMFHLLPWLKEYQQKNRRQKIFDPLAAARPSLSFPSRDMKSLNPCRYLIVLSHPRHPSNNAFFRKWICLQQFFYAMAQPLFLLLLLKHDTKMITICINNIYTYNWYER